MLYCNEDRWIICCHLILGFDDLLDIRSKHAGHAQIFIHKNDTHLGFMNEPRDLIICICLCSEDLFEVEG